MRAEAEAVHDDARRARVEIGRSERSAVLGQGDGAGRLRAAGEGRRYCDVDCQWIAGGDRRTSCLRGNPRASASDDHGRPAASADKERVWSGVLQEISAKNG